MNTVHLACDDEKRRQRRLQFGLWDLVLLPVFFAALFTAIRWLGVCAGMTIGSFSLICCAVLARRRRIELLILSTTVLTLVIHVLTELVRRIQWFGGGIIGF